MYIVYSINCHAKKMYIKDLHSCLLVIMFLCIPTQVCHCMKWVREEERSVEASLKPSTEIKVWEEVVRGRERRQSFSQILRGTQSGNPGW